MGNPISETRPSVKHASLHVQNREFVVEGATTQREECRMKKALSTGFAAMLFTFMTAPPCLGLTAEQVLQLRKAGVSDQTIQMMIAQEREAKDNAGDGMGVREIRDKDGNVVVVHSTGRSKTIDYSEQERQKLEKAWEILRNIIVDGRR
jgi:hypothetical protein